MGKNKLKVKAVADDAAITKERDALNENDENMDKNLQEGNPEIPFYADSSVSAYLWLLVFSILMFTFPFLTFYGVRDWMNNAFDLSTFQTNCFAVLAAVLVVNIIICLYVLKAFSESTEPEPQTQTVAMNKAPKQKKKE